MRCYGKLDACSAGAAAVVDAVAGDGRGADAVAGDGRAPDGAARRGFFLPPS